MAGLLGGWAAQLLARAVSLVASLVSVAVLSRELGVSGFGVWTVVVAWVALAAPFSDLGLSATILRHARGPDDATVRRRVAAALGLQLLVPLGVVPLVVGGGYLVVGHLTRELLVAACVLFPSGLYAVVQIPFAVTRRFVHTAVAEAVARVATAGATVLLATSGVGLPWLLGVLSLPPVIGLLLLGLLARRRVAVPAPSFDVRRMAALVKEALPVAASLALFAVYFRLDAVLLSALTDRATVGVYGLAYRVVEAVLAVPSLFMLVAYPRLVERRHDPAALAGFVSTCAATLAVAATPVLLLAIVGARPVMRLVGGSAYGRGGAVLTILLLSAVASYGTALLGQLLIVLGQTRYLLGFSLVNVGLNIVANLVLIPIAGMEGAAASTLLTEVVAVIVVGRHLRSAAVLAFPVATLLKCAAATGLASLVFVLVGSERPLAAGAAAAVTLLVALRVTGVVTPQQIREAVGSGA